MCNVWVSDAVMGDETVRAEVCPRQRHLHSPAQMNGSYGSGKAKASSDEKEAVVHRAR